jgi:hypothetical protein
MISTCAMPASVRSQDNRWANRRPATLMSIKTGLGHSMPLYSPDATTYHLHANNNGDNAVRW